MFSGALSTFAVLPDESQKKAPAGRQDLQGRQGGHGARRGKAVRSPAAKRKAEDGGDQWEDLLPGRFPYYRALVSLALFQTTGTEEASNVSIQGTTHEDMCACNNINTKIA